MYGNNEVRREMQIMFGESVSQQEYMYNLAILTKDRINTYDEWNELRRAVRFYIAPVNLSGDEYKQYENEMLMGYLRQHGIIDVWYKEEPNSKIRRVCNCVTKDTTSQYELNKAIILMHPKLFPEFWESGLSEREQKVLQAIDSEDDEYLLSEAEDVINRLWKSYQGKLLEKTSLFDPTNEIARMKEEINERYLQIEHFKQSIVTSLKDIDNINKEILFCDKNRNKEKKKNFINYIIAHDNLEVTGICNSYITLRINDLLEFDDPAKFYVLLNNPNSEFNMRDYSYEGTKYVLEKVCGERKGYIKISALVDIYDLKQCSVERYITAPQDYILNPHLEQHNCFGANEIPIIDAFQVGNYEAAIERIIASVKSVNWDEWISVKYLVQDVDNAALYPDRKIIRTLDGQDLSVCEAYEYFKSSEEKENE